MKAAAARSKFATDVMHRLWDSARSCWVLYQGKSIWSMKATPEKYRERLIREEGRNPDTLSVERVFVECK